MSKNELVDLSCKKRHETKAAYLFDFGFPEDVWIPKSMCQHHVEGTGEICTMEEWYAKKKGLI